MTPELPLVTIITPAYNRATYLKEVIDSVLDQEYPRVEYIVLDDGSKDNTVEILKRYGAKIKWESHPNMGETRTVNKGFRMASGDIICVVNSDDPLLPGAVGTAVQAFQESPEALVVYTDWLEIGSKSEPLREFRLPEYDIRTMLERFDVGMGPGTFFRRRAFELIGLRDETVLYTGDLDYWFRLALHGPLVHIPRTLATHRVHPDAASSSCAGGKMSHELVRLAFKICSDPKLPEGLQKQRNKILVKAHLVAMHYCGTDQEARLEHKAEWRRLAGWSGLARHAIGKVRYRTAHTIKLAWHQMFHLSLFVVKIFEISIDLMKLSFFLVLSRLSVGPRRRQPFRFLVVSHVLPPSWSGQAVILGRLLSGIDPQLYCLASTTDYMVGSTDGKYSDRLPSHYNVIGPEVSLPGKTKVLRLKRFDMRFQVLQRAISIGKIVFHEKCSAIIACTGDSIDPPAACLAARLTGTAFYLHFFDDYTYQWIEPITRRQARDLEGWMVSRTTGIIVPNEFMAQEVSRRHGREAYIVRNVCARRHDQMPIPVSPSDKDQVHDVVLLYTGAVYHVNSNTLRTVVTALEGMETPTVRMHVYAAQARGHLQLQGLAGPCVVHHPHAPYEVIERVQRSADILLVPFDFQSPAAEVIRTAAPGKLGDYLASGRPILAVVPGDCFVAWYLHRYDCGLVIDRADADEIAEGIRRLLQDADLQRRLTANAAIRAAEDFDPIVGQQALLHSLSKTK